jgi:hypothetical protein
MLEDSFCVGKLPFISSLIAAMATGLTRMTKNQWNNSATINALFDYFTANTGFTERDKEVIRNHKRSFEARPETHCFPPVLLVYRIRLFVDMNTMLISTQSLLTFPYMAERCVPHICGNEKRNQSKVQTYLCSSTLDRMTESM